MLATRAWGSDMKPNLERVPEDCKTKRDAKIKATTAMAITARDDAVKLGLKFEAYLLDMAVSALSENLNK